MTYEPNPTMSHAAIADEIEALCNSLENTLINRRFSGLIALLRSGDAEQVVAITEVEWDDDEVDDGLEPLRVGEVITTLVQIFEAHGNLYTDVLGFRTLDCEDIFGPFTVFITHLTPDALGTPTDG